MSARKTARLASNRRKCGEGASVTAEAGDCLGESEETGMDGG
jgi:hypothetical protein